MISTTQIKPEYLDQAEHLTFWQRFLQKTFGFNHDKREYFYQPQFFEPIFSFNPQAEPHIVQYQQQIIHDTMHSISSLSSLNLSSNSQNNSYSSPVLNKLDPVQLVVNIGKNIGPVGVRFLQVLGQYTNLTPELQAEFRSVFDAVPAQDKFTFFEALNDEAAHDPEVQKFLVEDLVSVDESLGGGSIMTTFNITVRNRDKNGNIIDGTHQEVLKIKNPGALRLVSESVTIIRQVIADMQKKDPFHKSDYIMTLRLLDTIERWITEDILDQDFLYYDQYYSGLHQGYYATNGVKVSTSTALKPNTAWIKRELLVTGDTLNKLITQNRSPSLVVNAINAVAQDYARHLNESINTTRGPVYILHSDIHPGNIIVNPNGQEVTLIDRNYYLHLNQEEVDFIKAYLNPSIPDHQKLAIAINFFVTAQIKLKKDLPAQITSLEAQIQKLTQQLDRSPGVNSAPIEQQINILQTQLSFLSKQLASLKDLSPSDANSLTNELFIEFGFKRLFKTLQGNQDSESGLSTLTTITSFLDKQQVEIPLSIRIFLKNLDSINRLLSENHLPSFDQYLYPNSASSLP